jgi:hypothetical protein
MGKLIAYNAKNKERMEREKVITLLRLVKENGLKLDIAADEICSLFNVSNRREMLIAFLMDIEECYGMDEREKTEKFVDDYLSNL